MLFLLKKILANKIFCFLVCKYIALALQFAASIFLAVKLGAYYFGIWSFIILVVNIGSICNWGIGSAATILLVQHKDDAYLTQKYIYNAALLVLFSFVPVLIILGVNCVEEFAIFKKYNIGKLSYAITSIILLQYICGFFASIFRVKNKIGEIILQQTLWPACMFAVIFFAEGQNLLYLLMSSYILALLISVVVYFRGGFVKVDGCLDKLIMKTIVQKGFSLFLYNVCFLLIMLSTKLQISYSYSVDEFGYFAFAFSLAQGVMLLLDSVVFLLCPKMLDMLKGNNVDAIRSVIAVFRKNYLLLLHLFFYFILAVSFPLFKLIPRCSSSFLPFIFILFTLVIHSNCFAYSSYLLAQNQEKKISMMVIIALVINVVLVWCLVAWLKVSFEFAVLGTLVTYTFYSLMVNSYSLFLLNVRQIKVHIRENFSLTMIYCIAVLFTVFVLDFYYWLWVPLIIFSVLKFKEIKQLGKFLIKLIHNDKLIDI